MKYIKGLKLFTKKSCCNEWQQVGKRSLRLSAVETNFVENDVWVIREAFEFKDRTAYQRLYSFLPADHKDFFN
jgi:hypothetical protein